MTRWPPIVGTSRGSTAMFDHIHPTIFWPAFVLVVFVFSLIVGLAISTLIRLVDTPSNKYVTRDWHTERKCRVTRNGFKTRAGIR